VPGFTWQAQVENQRVVIMVGELALGESPVGYPRDAKTRLAEGLA